MRSFLGVAGLILFVVPSSGRSDESIPMTPMPVPVAPKAGGTCHGGAPNNMSPANPVEWDAVCLPDSFENICAQMSPEDKKATQGTLERGNALQRHMGATMSEQMRIQANKLNQQGKTVRNDPDFFGHMWRGVHEEVRKQHLMKDEDRVRGVVAQALKVFRETVQASKILSPAQKASVDQALVKCFSSTPMVDYIQFSGRNASVTRSYMGVIPEKGRVPKKDLLAGAMGDRCMLKLSPVEWQECVEDTVECYSTLFHEFGHAVESCSALSAAITAHEVSGALKKNQEGVQKAFESWKNGTWTSDPMFEHLGETKDAGLKLFYSLAASTSCLSIVSQPKDAIPSACAIDWPKDLVRDGLERCGLGEAKDYPSQWSEAEADLWGAAAMARWMETTIPLRGERRRAVRRAVAGWCAMGFHNAKPVSDAEVNKVLDDMFKGHSPEQAAVMKKATKELLVGPEASECEKTPKVKGVMPWHDPHQPWPHRVNANMLRNTELRRALGCSDKGESCVAATCSPLEGLQMAAPK